MNQRGIALLSTLWLVAALSVVTASTLLLARVERDSALNRVTLARARWAADACLAIADGERGETPQLRDVDSTPLGDEVWCRATMEDLGQRVALDAANAEILARLVGDPGRAAALLDWLDADDQPRDEGAEGEWYRIDGKPLPRNGPMASVDELLQVRGFDSSAVARLRPVVRTGPSRPINANVADGRILEALPGLEPAAVELLLDRRGRGNDWRDLDGMLAALPANLRSAARARYAELQARVTFTADVVALHLEGHLTGTTVVGGATVLAVLAPGRLAVLAREEW